jgi:predicted metal-dependent peptidase
MKPELADALEAARWRLHRNGPAYFRAAVWALAFVESDQVGTLAVDDRWRVYVNAAFAIGQANTGERGIDGLAGIVLHECLHPTFRHGPRAKAIGVDDHAHWNTAGDCEINYTIDAAGVFLPSNGLRPHMFGWSDDGSAEEFYLQPRQKSQPQCSGGSGAGTPGPWELGDSLTDAHGSPAPAGLTDLQAATVRLAVARGVKDANDRRPGSVGGGILRWAREVDAPPKVDWRDMLSGKLGRALALYGSSPSYARPSRRQSPGGLVLPVHRRRAGRVALVLDTSGSMGDRDIGTILATVRDACLQLGKVWAIPCDGMASEPVEIRTLEALEPFLRGGGGTDMRIGIARAEELAPDAIVVVTDGGTPWPDVAPATPTTIVLTQDYGAPPAWADVIHAR